MATAVPLMGLLKYNMAAFPKLKVYKLLLL